MSEFQVNLFKIFNLNPVNGGSDEKISVDYGDNFVAAVPKGTAMSQVKVRFEPFKELLDENNALQAPITAGKTIGNLYFQNARRGFRICRWSN